MPDGGTGLGIATLCLLVLIPVAVFAPLRVALIAWLLMANFDASGSSFQSASSVGIVNAIKVSVVPVVLIWRMRHYGLKASGASDLPWRLWMVLVLYAAIAVLPSPYPLGGVKLIVNMATVPLVLVALSKAFRNRLISPRSLAMCLVICLGIAALQTYVFGGTQTDTAISEFGTGRFTSFVSPQAFAALMTAFLAVGLFWRESPNTLRAVIVAGAVVALVLTGSRTWFLGALFTLALFFCWRLVQGKIGAPVAVGCVTVSCLLIFSQGLPQSLAQYRTLATVEAFVTGTVGSNPSVVGTFDFRREVYATIVADLGRSSPAETAFGHGSASAAEAAAQVLRYREGVTDPNRIVHNEWLRALYEWGVIGLLILAAVCVFLLAATVSRFAVTRSASALAAIAYVLAFGVALFTENVLGGAGSGAIIGLGLVLGVGAFRDAAGDGVVHSASAAQRTPSLRVRPAPQRGRPHEKRLGPRRTRPASRFKLRRKPVAPAR